VRPVLIVVGLVLAQDLPQMVLVPDEGAVRELTAASSDPAFGYCVHAGRSHVTEHGPDPGIGEDRVECSREVRSPVSDHELHPPCLSAGVHDQVAGLLAGPFPGWVQRDSEDTDPPGRVLDHGQDVGLGAVEQISGEEVAADAGAARFRGTGMDRPAASPRAARPTSPAAHVGGVQPVGAHGQLSPLLPQVRCI
jgi:hypothetical protein